MFGRRCRTRTRSRARGPWFQTTLSQLIGFVSEIPTLFLSAFKSLTLEDIILVPKAFAKLAAVFGGFLGKFVSWGVDAMFKLLEIVFDVVSPGALGLRKEDRLGTEEHLQESVAVRRKSREGSQARLHELRLRTSSRI